jgi:hypothetical protein
LERFSQSGAPPWACADAGRSISKLPVVTAAALNRRTESLDDHARSSRRPAGYLFGVLPASCRQNETMRNRKTWRRKAGNTLERHHEARLNFCQAAWGKRRFSATREQLAARFAIFADAARGGAHAHP